MDERMIAAMTVLQGLRHPPHQMRFSVPKYLVAKTAWLIGEKYYVTGGRGDRSSNSLVNTMKAMDAGHARLYVRHLFTFKALRCPRSSR